MIVRLIAVDPNPRAGGQHDVLVYQVPENSREFEFLTQLFDMAKVEYTLIEPVRRKGQ